MDTKSGSNPDEAYLDPQVRQAQVQQVLSGMLSEQRVKARVSGIISATILATIPLSEIQKWTHSRLQGMIEDEEVRNNLPYPTFEELRTHLNALGVRVLGDSVELKVVVPPPRQAHAR